MASDKLPTDKTATEVLVECLDRFSESEGRGVVVVYTNADDTIVVAGNVRRGEAIGFMEIAKDLMLRRALE